ELIAYVKANNIPIQATLEKPYSTDRNLWHCSHEGGILEDPSVEAPEHIFVMTRDPITAPDRPQTVQIGFDAGIPVTVDGEALSPVKLLEVLNEIAGEHGIGRADVVEDRLVGMKSRGVYETPGGTLLYAAHRELEQLVLDRRPLVDPRARSARRGREYHAAAGDRVDPAQALQGRDHRRGTGEPLRPVPA